MNKTHIIYIPFTGVGRKVMTDEQLKFRIEIFKNYTLKSLLNQTNKNFVLWLSFKPEDEFNPLLLKLVTYLVESGVEIIVTYHGLLYHDDKNEGNNLTLEPRVRFSVDQIYKRFIQFKDHQNEKSWDFIYLTRIDSDDMFRENAIELIQTIDETHLDNPPTKALTFQLGYVYNKDTNELAEWNPLTNPPFHTIIFPRGVFFDAKKHIDWYEGFKSHEDIARLPHRVLWQGDNRQDRLYCVLIHNPEMHISTNWDHPFRGKLIIEGKEEILKQFLGNR